MTDPTRPEIPLDDALDSLLDGWSSRHALTPERESRILARTWARIDARDAPATFGASIGNPVQSPAWWHRVFDGADRLRRIAVSGIAPQPASAAVRP